MKNGWIKIYRKLLDKGYYKNSQYVHLWVHILLKANHKKKEFLWNNKIITVSNGQFITGRKELSRETGINESKVERILKCLETEQQIEQQKTTKYRLITVKKWSEYQVSEQQIEQQVNNKRTTSEQQVNTNKNDKNDKNEKKLINYFVFKDGTRAFKDKKDGVWKECDSFLEIINPYLKELRDKKII